jgi:antitoxin component YwqK of YwqJK toxin-antitoxin module
MWHGSGNPHTKVNFRGGNSEYITAEWEENKKALEKMNIV